MRNHWPSLLFCLAAGVFAAADADAQVDLFSPGTIHGLTDVREVAADGEASFVDGGDGKARYGGDSAAGWRMHSDFAEAGLEWRPRLNWVWSAVVDVTVQSGQSPAVDLLQAYVVYKPVPRSATSFSLRAGYFYPPISLEHDAPLWSMTNTITPSAINSWVGEEVKVAGLEGSVAHDFGVQKVSATAAVFADDETAGTLLTYRGWALHDLKSTLNGEFDLPALGPFATAVQPDETYSQRQVDDRAGYYGRLEWRPNATLDLDLFRFDNRGDKVSFTSDGQWAWDTRFWEAGATIRIDERTRILAQALSGRTQFGFETPQGLFADVSFRSAFILVSRQIGKATLSGRGDVFATTDNAQRPGENYSETGRALTADLRYPLGRHFDVRLEALRVWSDRPAQLFAGLAPDQAQTVLQSSLRLTF